MALGRLLLGSGTLPDDLRAQLVAEGLDQEEEGLPGTITYRHFRAPHRRSRWRRQWIRAALAISDRRLVVAVRGRPFVDVAWDDPRLDAMEMSVEDDRLLIAFDPALFDPRRSGRVELRLRSVHPRLALEQIRARAG
ncbi:MAG TPA: hypothetical protein PKD59_09360 [Miltoncostaeaceae bacterium]|nr:hypothetical protein [Miltoncostaeaceae bacterium]